MRIRIAAMTSILLWAACTAPKVTVTSPAPVDGKAVAPVDLQAELFATEARVTLTLQADASELTVNAWGLDGLEVVSPPAFTPSISKQGERQTLLIALKPGPSRSTLAVSVRGVFHGAALQRVATFALGSGPLPKTGEVIVTDQGEVLKGQRAPAAKPNTESTGAQ